MQSIAEKYYNSGIHVIPVVKGKKNPSVTSWNPKERLPLDKGLFDNKSIGVVCGYVSGGIEVIDFDNHFGDAETILSEFGGIDGVSEIMGKIVIEKTPSGGYHLIYKCKVVGNSKKLAQRINGKGKPDTLIETRGDGGYIVAAPSIGYELIQGSFENITLITAAERNILLTAAMALNEVHALPDLPHTPINSDRPGDLFNNSLDAANEALNELLISGWKQAKNKTHLIRPGKVERDGISATFSSPRTGKGILNVFSSNASPFEAGHGYTPYQIIALLKFNGDFSECSKWLKGRGFTSLLTKEQKAKIEAEVKKNLKAGRFLSPTEKNNLAEKLDIPVDLIDKEVEKAQKAAKDLEDYEDWPTIKKVEHFLIQNYKLRVNIVSRIAQMRTRKSDWESLNEHSIHRHLLHDEPKIKFSLEALRSLLKSDFVERYNPFIEYFENIGKWDGKDRIKELCTYFDVDDPLFFEIMLKKQLVRTIKCALEPDYYNRIVFVLSSQNEEIGKSRFFMWLNPFGFRYYSDEELKDNKDSRLALSENFIYNLEELDGLSKYGSAKLKATISTRGVNDRLPYATNKEFFPRRCSFFGSTNKDEFLLNDANTRWLTFKVRAINWQGYIKKIDIVKLWEQVWHMYKDENFDCELDADEKLFRNQRNDEFRIEDVEESVIKKNFIADSLAFMTNAEILAAIQLKSNGLKIQWNTVTLGKSLSRFGCEKKKNGNQRGWGLREINYNDEVINLDF